MKEVFNCWVLDINQETVLRGDTKRQEIWLWCVSEGGDRVLIVDPTFQPHVYLEPKGLTAELLASTIKGRIDGGISEVRVVKRKKLGKLIDVVEVVFKHSEAFDRLTDKFEEMSEVSVVYNKDLRPSNQYLIERNIIPSSWIKVSVKGNISVSGVKLHCFEAENIELSDYSGVPEFRTLYIYVTSFGKVLTAKGETPLVGVVKAGDKVLFLDFSEETKKSFEKLIELFDKYDPDIVVSWNGNRDGWDMLLKMAELNGLALPLGRNGSPPRRGMFGHVSIVGRAHIDLRDIAEEILALKSKTLEEMALYHGVLKAEVIDEPILGEMWSKGLKEEVSEYLFKLIYSLESLYRLYIDYIMHLSRLVNYPIDYVIAASPGNRVDGYVVAYTIRSGGLVPPRGRGRQEWYRGGMVFKPKPGLHEGVAVLDFASMYPHIIVKYNVSPDTLVRDGVCDECYIAPEVGYKFLKEPDGIYREPVKRLLEDRAKIKKFIKSLPEGSPERRALEAQEKAIKVVANAMYGYLGWPSSRWYMREIAEAITAWGRYIINRSAEIARSMGLDVIYGDTDSLFLKYDEEKINEFIKRIEEELGMDIKIDAVYQRVLFTEAKKRYAGLTVDGKLDLTGFEAVRGDWCSYAKMAQIEVLNTLLSTGSKSKTIEVAKRIIEKFEKGEFEIKDVVIWKSVDKPISEYEVNVPHVAVAKQLINRGIKVKTGDRIGYVVMKGSGPLYKRVTYYLDADIKDIDKDYYIEKQIMPAILRVLAPLGVNEKQLKTSTISSLEAWF